MNLSSERGKPIFVTRPDRLTSLNAVNMVNEALANSSAIKARRTDDFMLNASAARRLSREILVRIDEALPQELKELVITRLESDRDETFEFLDGRTFTGPQAATEVERGSVVGDYFLELEKETLRIVQDAFFKGQFS